MKLKRLFLSFLIMLMAVGLMPFSALAQDTQTDQILVEAEVRNWELIDQTSSAPVHSLRPPLKVPYSPILDSTPQVIAETQKVHTLEEYGIKVPEVDSMSEEQLNNPQRIYDAMIELKKYFPEGTSFTNEGDKYVSLAQGSTKYSGLGCHAFALMLSDAAFGDLYIQQVTDFSFESINIGDVLRVNNETHTVVVIGKDQEELTLAEANYNSSVHWGRTIKKEELGIVNYVIKRSKEPIYVEQINLTSESNTTVQVNDVIEINVELLPANCSEKAISITRTTNLEYDKEKSSSKKLVFTAISPGEAYVTVTAADSHKKSATYNLTIVGAPIPIEKIEITPTEQIVEVDETKEITYKVLPETATQELEVSSTFGVSGFVADFDTSQFGVVKVTGLAVGEATLVINAKGNESIKAECKITVVEKTPEVIPVEGITLTPSAQTLRVGENLSLQAKVIPENATNQKVSFVSSEPDVAEVDQTGQVTAKAVGEAVITAITEDGNKEATAAITVAANKIDVTGVTLTPETQTVTVGESFDLTATVIPTDATNKDVTFKSNKPEIADVDNTGKVTAKAVGEAVITVTTVDQEQTAQMTVTVNPVSVTGVTLTPASATVNIGKTLQLTATVQPENATNKEVSFSSDTPAVATVDNTGLVTGLSEGTATITVTTTDQGEAARATITVEPIPVSEVTLNTSSETLTIGESYDLVATVLPADATNKNVRFSSSNVDVANVDNSGHVTAYNVGTAEITVTTEDQGKTATALITVEPIHVTGVTLTPATYTVLIGESFDLSYQVVPENATDKTVRFTSSNPEVAQVDANGHVTAQKVGTANITVTTTDQAKTATMTVTVEPVKVEDVLLSPTTKTVNVNDTVKLETTVIPPNATNNAVTFKSSDDTIATVDESGLVTAVNGGTVEITVTTVDQAKTASMTLTVLKNRVEFSSGSQEQEETPKAEIKDSYESEDSEIVAVEATASENEKFVGWKKDGKFVTTANPYPFELEDDVVLTPVFSSDLIDSAEFDNPVEVTVKDTNEDEGSVIGSGIYEKETNVVLVAIPEDGYQFVGWKQIKDIRDFSADEELYSVDNPLIIELANEDMRFEAIFEAVEEDDPETEDPGTQKPDPEKPDPDPEGPDRPSTPSTPSKPGTSKPNSGNGNSENKPSIPEENKPAGTKTVQVYRVYNEASGEHLYTTDLNECRALVAAGWRNEGKGWTAPEKGDSVYRLYSPVTGEHLYTVDLNEVKALADSGVWRVDNLGRAVFYSGGDRPIYRTYHEGIRMHHLTTDKNEYSTITQSGWNDEGIAFYAN